MSQYSLSAGYRPPIVRCIANGHIKVQYLPLVSNKFKTAQWLFSKALPNLSPEDVSLLAASLVSVGSREPIYNTLSLLPKMYTHKLIFNGLLKGHLPLVNEIEEKVTSGQILWKNIDSDDNVLFSFTEQESAELFIKVNLHLSFLT